MEYTKGEWIVAGKTPIAYAGYNICDNTQGILTKEVAIVYPTPQGKSDIYGEANARLIAAAPDLYKACKFTAQRITGYAELHPQLTSLLKAIAKAESK